MNISSGQLAPTPGENILEIVWNQDILLGLSDTNFVLEVLYHYGTELTGPPIGLQRVMGNEGLECWVADDEQTFSLWRPGLSFSLDLAAKTGQIRLGQPRYWQDVLRVICFIELLPRRGLLLHASGLVRDERAFLFPGPSGAGKTTIVRHSPGLTLLSDDIVAVRLLSGNGPVKALGTVFYGEWGKPGEQISAPLQGFYFPVKAKEDRLVPLNAHAVLSRLLPCVCTFTTWRPRLQRVFELAAELAERVPGYELHFRQGPDFWQVIDAA